MVKTTSLKLKSKFNEKKMQSLWTKYVKANKKNWNVTTVWELKITKEKRLSFQRLEEHQEQSLNSADSGSGDYHKLSDMSMDQKPWDCQLVKCADAFVVVLFYKPYKKKEFISIAIEDWEDFKEACPMKSITESEAKSIATDIVTL